MINKKTVAAGIIGVVIGYTLHSEVNIQKEKISGYFEKAREAKAKKSYIKNNTDTSNLIQTGRYHIDKNQFEEYLKAEGINPTQDNIHTVAKALRKAYSQMDKPLGVYEDKTTGRHDIGNAAMTYGDFSGVSGKGNPIKLFDINGDGKVLSKPTSLFLNSEDLRHGIQDEVNKIFKMYNFSNKETKKFYMS